MHGDDFTIVDRDVAYLAPAKAMAMTIVDLLADDARRARHVLDDYRPRMEKAEYLRFMRGLARQERIELQA
jgi:hypothetical protein